MNLNDFIPLYGLLLGIVLRVVLPYLREGLQTVAQSGTFKAWPVFDWRYLAMVLIPITEYGLAFLTVQGLWQTMFTWGFIPAVAMAYAGTDLGKEIVQGISAAYRIANGR